MLQIVDTTLRDGEQKAGIALNSCEKIAIAKILDYIGVDQIEAGTPVMGGTERAAIEQIVELGLKSRISAWNRLHPRDIQTSIDCGVDIVHISVPASDLHIFQKLNQSRPWVIDKMKFCIDLAVSQDTVVHIGLEDASRADMEFLLELSRIAKCEGAERVRYADTVGVLTPTKTFFDLGRLTKSIPLEWGIHVHNDFGMAVANTLAGIEAGVEYVDCTIGGVGERTGNCNLSNLLIALKQTMRYSKPVKAVHRRLIETEEEILDIFYNRRSISAKTLSFA